MRYYQKALVLVIAYTLIPCTLFAQGLKVKEMKQVMSDLSGSVHQRMDSLGVPCGLVKVMIENPDVSFGGNMVGDVDNKMNEYWVYLPKGTKELSIKRKNYLPMSIRFADYGVDEVESKITYQMVLKEVTFKKNSIYISINPKYASLTIDNNLIDVDPNGIYEFFLNKGEYLIKAEAKGFRKYVDVIEIGRNNEPLILNLESLLADVTISSETNGADISINDEKVCVGTWVGHLPAGSYKISSHKEGYEPYIKEVNILEKEIIDIKIPQLKQLKGNISIVSNITDFTDVKIDGKDSETKNGQIVNVTSGKHVITLGKYGYGNVEIPVFVKGNGTDTIRHTFVPLKEYEEAIKGEKFSMYGVAIKCGNSKDYKQALYWYNLAIKEDGQMGDYYQVIDTYKALAELMSRKKDIPELYDFQRAMDLYIDIIKISKDEKKYGHLRHGWDTSGACDQNIQMALYLIGNLYRDIEKYEDAISWYQKCWDFNHDDSYYFDYCLDAGDCNIKLGKIEEAKLWYSRVIDSRCDLLQEKAKKKLRLLNYEYQ